MSLTGDCEAVEDPAMTATRPSVQRSPLSKIAALALVMAVVAALAVATICLSPASVRTTSLERMQELEEQGTEHCSEANIDCRSSRCCKVGGQTCFEKNQWYATCMDACIPGQPFAHDEDQQAWTCKPLGDRAPVPLSCSWAGSDCSKTRQCCQQGYQCMQKDQYWSACTQVEQGPWTADGTPAKTLPKPDGWQGTNLGGWRSEFQVYGVDPKDAAKTTLFCFMAILMGSAEEKLVDVAWNRKSGIFGCEDSRIYHAGSSNFSTWSTGQSTLVNTGVFVKIWQEVRTEGKYQHQDWTVKADADCIFFPARLRSHLQALNAPAYTPLYIKNTLPRYTNGGFLGAIEVFSKTAVEAFVDNSAACAKHMGLKSGEDGYLKDCLDALGVGFMTDELMMHPSGLASECQVKEFASYHPFKSSSNWTTCYDIAVGNIALPPLLEGSVGQLPDSIKGIYS